MSNLIYEVDFDEETELWCVFDTTGRAVSSWCDESSANEDCEKLNGKHNS